MTLTLKDIADLGVLVIIIILLWPFVSISLERPLAEVRLWAWRNGHRRILWLLL